MTPVCTLTSGSTLAPIIGNATAPPTSLDVLPVGTHEVYSGYARPQPATLYAGRSKFVFFYGSELVNFVIMLY